jgi:hypothetical protein
MHAWPFRRKEPGPSTPEQLLGSLISATATAGPEKDFSIVVADEVIRCTRHDRSLESIAVTALRKVELVGTDWGPFLPDQFWVLHGADGQLVVIPLGATGEEALMKVFHALPEFRYDLCSEAMCLTCSLRFVVWESEGRQDAVGPQP